MRIALVAFTLLAATAAIARAQVADPTSATAYEAAPVVPQALPPPPPMAVPKDSTIELGVHLGLSSATYWGLGTNSGDAISGSGTSIDVEVAWRQRRLSLRAYCDYTKAGLDYTSCGGRVRVHLGPLFAGVGMGMMYVAQNSHLTASVDRQDSLSTVFDVHGGIRLPKLGSFAPEVIGVLQGGVDAYTLARISIGVAF